MKKFIFIFLLLGTLSVSAKDGLKKSKQTREIENTYAAASRKADLRKDKTFMKKLLRMIAKADDEAAYVIDRYYVFIYASGLKQAVAEALSKMPDRVRQSETGIRVQNQYYSLRDLNEGAQVPDFTMNTPDGKSVNFYTFLKGKKCVILDFWASWCGWCRKESPFVQKVYDRYKGADFDVISVSFDTKRKDWVQAIEEDGTTWTQVSDLRGTDEGLYKWYNLNGIPAIFLIDGEGRILYKKLRGLAIEEKVKMVLNK
ncbi:TlpA disulfide reductase family protein [uncultured Butyricimonas sp.]|uniref:TlpA family protein disulfide reductase n=1 Tax=uncultured Butyricimonas sp. TaxID=1268785 RepID=UPI0026DCBABF|nr:TlpA disulfide reductase family protein [uncultured Butyricimonas sp.]